MKILGFQLSIEEKIDDKREFVVEELLTEQLESSFKLIEEYNPDIAIFPEICYVPSYYETYKNLSQDKIIIAGSYYKDGINTTMVFKNQQEPIELPKIFPSPFEPMFLNTSDDNEKTIAIIGEWENDFKNNRMPKYFIKTNDEKHVAILNCLDYYKLGYYVARSNVLSKDLIALISPCSNNRPDTFIDESKAIHNHNPEIYSIIINSHSNLNGEKFSVGHSYIFGMIDFYQHKHLFKQEKCFSHSASIMNLEREKSAMFLETVNRFCLLKRSDYYTKTPKVIEELTL